MTFKKEIKKLTPEKEKAFKHVIVELKADSWDSEINNWDKDWEWIILALKKIEKLGVVLRRIKPIEIKNSGDVEKAIKLQEKLRPELIEVWPYKFTWSKNRNLKVKILKQLYILGQNE